jgi:hypothetical protein
MSNNQTQAAVHMAAVQALAEWFGPGERTYERLMAIADRWADSTLWVCRPLPKVMVWTETLRLMRERVPDAMPAPADAAPCSFCNGTGFVIAQPGDVRMPCPFTSRHADADGVIDHCGKCGHGSIIAGVRDCPYGPDYALCEKRSADADNSKHSTKETT